MVIGLISDTHNIVPADVHAVLAGVDFILHAGDICDDAVIEELETIAPVRRVRGNMDPQNMGGPYLFEEYEGVGVLLIHHSAEAFRPWFDDGKSLAAKFRPEVILCGHTHRSEDTFASGIRLINPGSASQPRGTGRPSVARIVLKDGQVGEVLFINLKS